MEPPVAIVNSNKGGTADNSSHAVVAYGTYKKANRDYLVVYDSYTGFKLYWDETYVRGNMAWLETILLNNSQQYLI